MKSQPITLRGPAARGSTVSGSVLHGLLGVLLEGCQRVVRLIVEGRSTAAGEAPAWLERVIDFDVSGIEAGSTRLVIEASPLREVLPEMLGVRSLGAETTALDLFVRGLSDAVRADVNSALFDLPLLETYAKLERVLRQGFDVIEFVGDPPLRLDAASLDAIGRSRLRIPPPRQVRVAGRLASVPHDDRAFTLQLDEGVVRGLVSERVSPAQLARSVGAPVVVSGLAVFRPSGAVLRLEAHRIDEADERAGVWGRMPRPLFEAAEPVVQYRVRQDPRSGLAAIMGKWPGDESDEEIAEILEQLS
jgi:hypothetical protein